MTEFNFGIPLHFVSHSPFDESSASTDNFNDIFSSDHEFSDFFDEYESSALEKRSRNFVDACGCPHKSVPENFGPGIFPQFHKSKVCDYDKIKETKHNQNYCKYGSSCKQVYHEIKVLILHSSEKEVVQRHLPADISKKYSWTAKNISIGCRCLH